MGQSNKLVFYSAKSEFVQEQSQKKQLINQISFNLWTLCLVIIVQVISCRSISDTFPSISTSLPRLLQTLLLHHLPSPAHAACITIFEEEIKNLCVG